MRSRRNGESTSTQMSLYLDPWIQVANSVGFKVALVFVTKHSRDDDDDDGDDADRSQNRGDDPEIVGGPFHYSCMARAYGIKHDIFLRHPLATSVLRSFSKTQVH